MDPAPRALMPPSWAWVWMRSATCRVEWPLMGGSGRRVLGCLRLAPDRQDSCWGGAELADWAWRPLCHRVPVPGALARALSGAVQDGCRPQHHFRLRRFVTGLSACSCSVQVLSFFTGRTAIPENSMVLPHKAKNRAS